MEFLQVMITGLGQGCLYGLIALGFVLIYKATEIVNFAQGDLLMMMFSLVSFVPLWFFVFCSLVSSGSLTSGIPSHQSPRASASLSI